MRSPALKSVLTLVLKADRGVNVRNLIAGLVIGLFVGTGLAAKAAVVAGENGYVLGWTVVKDGEEICDDPFFWTTTQEIECD